MIKDKVASSQHPANRLLEPLHGSSPADDDPTMIN